MNLRHALTLSSAILATALASSCASSPQPVAQAATQTTVDVAKVVSQELQTTVHLPGELQPYESVAIYPRVSGFLDWIGVDRGSHVKKDELIARLTAPELTAQRAEAQSKLQGAESQLAAAQAKLSADESTSQKLASAARTPGVVAGNDLLIAQKASEADEAQAKAAGDNVEAAKNVLQAVAEMEGYLQIRAPFDGVVTERNVHPGALVGPTGSPAGGAAMLRIETPGRLRLVVPVPEIYVAHIPAGTKVDFTVSSLPNKTFQAPIARISDAIDERTRTMPVELDVANPSGQLAAGAFSEVLWPVRRPGPTLFVPASAITTNLQRTFVIRVTANKAEWVDVTRGLAAGDLLEVFGALKPGDAIVLRGTDTIRPGDVITPRAAE